MFANLYLSLLSFLCYILPSQTKSPDDNSGSNDGRQLKEQKEEGHQQHQRAGSTTTTTITPTSSRVLSRKALPPGVVDGPMKMISTGDDALDESNSRISAMQVYVYIYIYVGRWPSLIAREREPCLVGNKSEQYYTEREREREKGKEKRAIKYEAYVSW